MENKNVGIKITFIALLVQAPSLIIWLWAVAGSGGTSQYGIIRPPFFLYPLILIGGVAGIILANIGRRKGASRWFAYPVALIGFLFVLLGMGSFFGG